MLAVECKFENWPWIDDRRYTCSVEGKKIPADQPSILDGRHAPPHSNFDVIGANFTQCRVARIPGSLMLSSFPFLQALAVSGCGLREIRREDLRELRDLRVLWLNDNELEFLPGDLLVGMRKLEFVSFERNKIRYVGAELLDPLESVKMVNFLGNAAIDLLYSSACFDEGATTLEEVKVAISEQCKPPAEGMPARLESSEDLQLKLQEKDRQIEELREQVDNLRAVEASLHDEVKRLQSGTGKLSFYVHVFQVATRDSFSDLAVLTRGEKFRVHKAVMAARSPTIERMLRTRADLESCTFTDLPSAAFREVLKYFYEDQLPADDSNFGDVLAVASKLELDDVKAFAVAKLEALVDAENALEMLALANKFEVESLRERAFEQVQKLFPERDLKDEAAQDVAKLRKLFEAKKKLDDEFHNL